MSRSVLFASGKGGTGKSSLCLHVAGALARRGLRVLVVEATPGFRGLEIALELPGETVYDLSDALEGRCSLGDALLVHQETQLRLMPAPEDPFYLPEEKRLSAFFSWGRERWDLLFIDAPPAFPPILPMLAKLCDLGILVTTPEEVAARFAGKASVLLAREGLAAQRLVINRIPRDFVPTPALRDLDDVIDLCGVQLLGALPEREGGRPPPGEEPLPGLLGQELEAIARRLLGERAELALFL